MNYPQRHHKPWITEETNYLRDQYGMVRFEEMETFLGRKARAIDAYVRKQIEAGTMRRQVPEGCCSISSTAQIIGRDQSAVWRLIHSGDLQVVDRYWGRNNPTHYVVLSSALKYKEGREHTGAPRRARKSDGWTPEENQFLKENYGNVKFSKIWENIHRTPRAIEVHILSMIREGEISRATPEGYMTITEGSQYLDMPRSSVTDLVTRKTLPSIEKHWHAVKPSRYILKSGAALYKSKKAGKLVQSKIETTPAPVENIHPKTEDPKPFIEIPPRKVPAPQYIAPRDETFKEPVSVHDHTKVTLSPNYPPRVSQKAPVMGTEKTLTEEPDRGSVHWHPQPVISQMGTGPAVPLDPQEVQAPPGLFRRISQAWGVITGDCQVTEGRSES